MLTSLLMQALRFVNGRLSVDDTPKPPTDTEAIVKVTVSGICNTDIEIARGYAGFEGTIGHEFVGVVEQADDTRLVGKRVVGEINAGCGECSLCRGGDSRHCPGRTVLGIVGRDGAHAEYLSLPTRNLIPVPDHVTDEQAVFAEPLAAALAITEQVSINRETRVAVIGDGKLGLLCAFVLAFRSEHVYLLGRHEDKMQLAELRGIRTGQADKSDGLRREFDIVVEASGSESGFASAVELVKPRGAIVLKSTFHGTPTWEASRIVVDEITIVGSRCGRLESSIAMLAGGSIDLSGLITDRLSLADGIRAMRRAQEKGVLKVLLVPGPA